MRSLITAFAAAALLLSGCSKLENPAAVPLDEIIKLQFTGSSTIPADGASTTTVQATLPREASNRSVKFTTTRGSFQGTDGKAELTVTADEAGVAAATLIAGREAGSANVTATVGTVTTSIQLPETRALAQTMTAETTSAFATKNGVTKPAITAILARQPGFVTNGTRVTFDALQQGSDGAVHSVGRIFNVSTTDANGRATAVFAADTPDAVVGPVTIRITTATDSGGTLTTDLPLRIE